MSDPQSDIFHKFKNRRNISNPNYLMSIKKCQATTKNFTDSSPTLGLRENYKRYCVRVYMVYGVIGAIESINYATLKRGNGYKLSSSTSSTRYTTLDIP